MKERKKILLVEDFSSSAKGIIERLNEMPDCDFIIDWVDDCDQAMRKVTPKNDYDLVITDVHFKDEGQPVELEEGSDLVIQLNKLENKPFIIVYSMVNQPVMLDLIINSIGVDGYIIKGRKSLDELAYSLKLIFMGGQYISREASRILSKNKEAMRIDRLDRNILRKLYGGYKINELPIILRKEGFVACSQPSIENRIKDLKDYFDVKTTIQLVAVAKEKKVFMD